ncbi:hypothetical protein GCM10023347_34150 [Streptomyces chumphonensis]|uniref:Helix-turn-helix transcriptional regulator n=1 Tax=Streptomyces chumphonensis TaxID=1214925 RepID=A0A927EXQ7_9ACTN|nr:helix-turn-helix transcriptional regulator [Streptomyces chumphonensis]MBD3931915.1 helix-turn-helix transcriptional regulator [Streptomyces chumphonensis]
MPDTPDIGSRLRSIRKRRGLTQRELAQAAGVSTSLVSKLEQGVIGDVRLETARQLAVALRVSTTSLLQRDEPGPPPVEIRDQWAAVRAALTTPPTDEVQDAPTVDGTRRALTAAEPLFAADQFSDLARILPPLLRDAEALGSAAEARAIRTRTLQLTGWLLVQTRQFEAAEVALARALDGAADRLDGAATVSTMCWLMLRTGRLAEALDWAVRWADDVEPRVTRATPDELSAWGWMLLRVSAAAVRDNRPDVAEDSLRWARSAAVALGREHAPRADFLRTFGPVTVALKAAENASVVQRPDRVLTLAKQVPASSLRPTSNNRNRHLLDVANAHASLRDYGSAVEVLESVRAGSPQWLPQQRFARDIVGRIVGRRRTLTPEMRELATAVALPL